MDSQPLNQHLSQIQTLWTLVRQAHQGTADSANSAQHKLLDRYGGAVKRYLLGALRDADAADELFQEFACRLLKGDMRGADPQRGRFRNFVKGVLFHLVADHHNRRQRRPKQMAPDHPEPAIDPPSFSEMDRDFLKNWRDEVLARSWKALQAVEQETGQPFFTVLRFRADHPKLSSQEMAAKLGELLGKTLTAAGVRQTLHRARERFGDLVLDEVIQAMEQPTAAQLEEELLELGLLNYCQPALDRRS